MVLFSDPTECDSAVVPFVPLPSGVVVCSCCQASLFIRVSLSEPHINGLSMFTIIIIIIRMVVYPSHEIYAQHSSMDIKREIFYRAFPFWDMGGMYAVRILNHM